jgi:hypothetical protein
MLILAGLLRQIGGNIFRNREFAVKNRKGRAFTNWE